MRNVLSSEDLVAGFHFLPDSKAGYNSFAVFADDVQELHYVARHAFSVLASSGTLLMMHSASPVGVLSCASDWVEARRVAARLRGDGTDSVPPFGLLMAPYNPSSHSARCFPLVFDETARQWRPYAGGLVPWLKETLGRGWWRPSRYEREDVV